MVYLFYTTYFSVNLAHYVIVHAEVGKGGMTEYLFLPIVHKCKGCLEKQTDGQSEESMICTRVDE